MIIEYMELFLYQKQLRKLLLGSLAVWERGDCGDGKMILRCGSFLHLLNFYGSAFYSPLQELGGVK